jgi:hypothetical protein
MAWGIGSSLWRTRTPDAPTFEGSHELAGGPMHTHDLENHDNLYADEGTMVIGETRADAQSHAYWAVGAIALMVVGLGVALVIS